MNATRAQVAKMDMLGIDPRGRDSGDDPKVMLLAIFVDWAKKTFCDELTNEQTQGRTDLL